MKKISMKQVGCVAIVALAVAACSSTTDGSSSGGTSGSSSGSSGSTPNDDASDGSLTSNDDAASSDGGAQGCAARAGNYRYTDARVSGDCGDPLAPQTFSIETSTQGYAIPYVISALLGSGKSGDVAKFNSECSGVVKVSADNCTVEYSTTCPLKSPTGRLENVGTIVWSPDGKSATESRQLRAFSTQGAALCAGMYRAEVTK